MRARARNVVVGAVTALATTTGLLVGGAPAGVAADPTTDPFYTYTGATPLKELKPGTVLKTRSVPYSIQGLPLPLEAVQVLYRTRNTVGRAVVNATTVVRPLLPIGGATKVLSYQSFYDSLNPADQPSAAIAGGQGIGPAIAHVETLVFAPALLAGYTINIPDTEGQTANFASGREYGYTTLDSLRAISRTPRTGVGGKAPIGLMGYSGGAIATGWAAELAASYAPGIARRIVGSAMGGVLVHPGRNLRYVEGSQVWAGVMPMALVGIARAFEVNLTKFMNPRGRQIMADMEKASISEVLGAYPGLTWKQIAKKEYADPYSVPVFVRVANKLIMSTAGTPSAPMFIGQGTGGELEGTPGTKAGIGKGDGVMIAGDVRTLARRYCDRGVTVKYQQYRTSHFTAVSRWLPEAYGWLLGRFTGQKAPSTCGSIAKGTSLAPLTVR